MAAEEQRKNTLAGSFSMPLGEPDVVVCIKGSEFLAHKEILMASSPYLKDILQEIGTEQKIKVELEGVSPSAFEALRSYMYMGNIRITCQNVTDVYRCAYKLRIRTLISKCLQYLAESGEVGRHVVLYVNALKVGMKDEEKVAFQFLIEHFDSVMRCREFLDLNPDELCSLLKSDVLGTSNEINVFIAALAWLEHDYMKRRMQEEHIMECVRFPLMDDPTLMKCFKPPICPDACVNASVKIKLVKALFTHLAISRDRDDLVQEYRAKPRTYLAEGPCICWDKDGVVKHFEKCSYTRGNQILRHEAATTIQDAYRRYRGWRLKSTLPKPEPGADVVEPGAYAEFVPSWVDSSESLTAKVQRDASQDMPINTEVYEAVIGKVIIAQSFVRRFLARRYYNQLHAKVKPSVPLENVLDEDDPYQHFLVRHPGSRTVPASDWAAYPAMTLPKFEGDIQDADNSVVLILGGVEPAKSYEMGTGCTILRFNPKNNELTRCGRLPQPRHNHTAAFLNGYVYIIGGFDTRNTHSAIKYATKTCFRLNLLTKQWERIADMHHARCNHATVAYNHKVCVVAGQDEFDRFLSSVEMYDPFQDIWIESPVSLCCKMSACGATVFGGALHIAGGVVQSRKRTDKVFLVSSVEKWDSTFQRWLKEATQLPTGRSSMSFVAFQEHLYAIGGLTKGTDDVQLEVTPEVLCYNRKKNAWETPAPLPVPLHGAGVVSVDESMLLFGGLKNVNQTDASKDIIAYDHRQDVWKKVAQLPCGLSGFALAVLPPTVPHDRPS
ncbi:beta-scruin-like [Ornithodoros turicata]|uniref:beta-scruin-like n=1 Tax=Ornithodoros turicata TaxID=34597 RepID=UPI00313917FA